MTQSSSRRPRNQLDLFAGDAEHGPRVAESAGRGAPISAVEPEPRARELARALPGNLRMGTSSWSFPGWHGLVYGGAFSERALSRRGLTAYAQHPLMSAVGVDRTHYAPVPSQLLAEYAEAVPAHFRFLVKAHEASTLARFPAHARYGRQAGQENPRFLDPAYAAEHVVAPALDGMADKLGGVLFQFAPQPLELLGGAARFADRLHEFLARLPRGPCYVVELRNPALLTRRYGDALAAAGAGHCVNLMGNMPPPALQWQVAGNRAAPALVIRWMLSRGLSYSDAVARYQPFDAVVDPDPVALTSIARLVRAVPNLPTYVIVNNKAEGSAPLSIARLAETLVAQA